LVRQPVDNQPTGITNFDRLKGGNAHIEAKKKERSVDGGSAQPSPSNARS
jgi:hypothetical protein